MAQLNFSSVQTGGYEAIATVNSDFNLHLERGVPGILSLEVSTLENGSYVPKLVDTHSLVIDQDIHASVYPKYIRVYSSSLPTEAYITESESDTDDQ